VFEITRENGRLLARGTGDAPALEEAVRAFVSAEIAAMPVWLPADAVEEARAIGKRLLWHPGYDRPAWPDTDPPLEIVHVWRSKMLHPNCVVFYKCQRNDCLRCHNPEAEWSSHHKTIRPDGMDYSGAAVEVEIRRGKRRDTMTVLVDQPVFVLEETKP
jgi:hypothetical protein